MSPSRDDDLRNLIGGDYSDHRNYKNPKPDIAKLVGIVLPLLLLLCACLYSWLYSLDLVALTPLDLLWNWFVWVVPSRLLEFFDSELVSNPNAPQTHASKSERMRRLLGLDTPGGIMNTVAQASRRRLSSLPGIGLMQGNESRPAGLGNWDNSCYQNSVLQGLASLDNFSDYLVDPRPDQSENQDSELKMANSLRGLIATLKDPSNNGKRIWTPPALKSMSSWQQQDAQEYFSKVLDEIDKEIIKAAKAIKGADGLESSPVMASKKLKLSSPSVGISSLRNPLEGLLAQRVGCTRCGYSEGLSMIPFNCLTVPLGRSWSYSLSACLDEYTTLEPIEGVECGKCTLLKNQRLLNLITERLKDAPENDQVRITTTSRLQAVNEALEDDDYEEKTLTQKCRIPAKNRVTTTKSRQAVIARPPKSLVVHVNRSMFDEMTGELRKNTAEVRFPKLLNLAPWCLGSSGSENNTHHEEWLLDPAQSMIAGSDGDARIRGPVYELRAVVTHYGRHENGHYICYRKHPLVRSEQAIEDDDDTASTTEQESQWWRLSDDDVTSVSESTVQGQGGVFMLFYDCIDPAVPIAPKTAEEEELELAVGIRLPEDYTDDPSNSETEEGSFQSRYGSSATSVTDDDGRHDEFISPIQPIIVPPFVQNSSNKDHSVDRRQSSVSGSMIVV